MDSKGRGRIATKGASWTPSDQGILHGRGDLSIAHEALHMIVAESELLGLPVFIVTNK